MKNYLLDKAPNGETKVLVYSTAEMVELFTFEQRSALTAGERVIKHWSKRASNHVVVDMTVHARKALED